MPTEMRFPAMIKNSNTSLILVDNTDTVLRFKRDKNDSTGNLFNYHSKDEKIGHSPVNRCVF